MATNKTNINHFSENTKSYQLVKSVLKDKSKGVFQGKIFVDHNSFQISYKLIIINQDTTVTLLKK